MVTTIPPKMLKNAEDAHLLMSGNPEHLRASSGLAALDRLQTAGIGVTVEGDRLSVSPRHRLTDELRALIRNHKAELIDLLRTDVDLRDLVPTSMRLGSLVCCDRCQHFEPRAGDHPDGWCRRYSCETWAWVPLECAAWGRA